MKSLILPVIILFICLIVYVTVCVPVKQENIPPARQDTIMTDDSIPVVSLEKN